MNDGKICISIYAVTADELLEKIDQAVPLADFIELRFDLLPPDEIDAVFNRLPLIEKTYLLTYRPKEQGGAIRITMDERIAFWFNALLKIGDHKFLVDHEFDTDFRMNLRKSISIISYHDFTGNGDGPKTAYKLLEDFSKKTQKIAVRADTITDSIEVWTLIDLAASKNKFVIPIAMGEAGKWTRILGLAHGAFMTYASLAPGGETAPGQITAADMLDIYRVKKIDKTTDVYGIIAGDTSYSMSPYIHNPAFKTAGVNAVFIPLQVSNLDEFLRRMVKPETREVDLNFKGFAVTNPHKESIIRHLDFVEESVRSIGAANTVKIIDGKLHGYNTDAGGFITPLEETYGNLSGAKVAVVGAGGAARGCIYALKDRDAEVTVFARDRVKARRLADEFAIECRNLGTDFSGFDILINATPLGTKGELEKETVAKIDQLRELKLVYDLIYNPTETRLLAESAILGIQSIGGLEMLIAQAARQFEIWTGIEAPIAVMKESVRKRLSVL